LWRRPPASDILYVPVVIFTLHSALNLLWLGISVSALAWFAHRESRRVAPGRWRRLLAVCAICITIFPAISDSDDLFSFSLLRVPDQRHGGVGSTPPPEDSREKSTLQLVRLLESLEHFQIAGFYCLCLTLAVVAMLRSVRPVCLSRAVLAHAGRAPPLS
jgi:hypothetical protein